LKTQPHRTTLSALVLVCWMAPACAPADKSADDTDGLVTDTDAIAAYPNPDDAPARLTTPVSGTRLDHAARDTVFFCARAMLPVAILPGLTQIERPWVVDNEVITADIPYVDGAVNWEAEFAVTETETERRLKGNGLPNHPTGTFPVQDGTAAYPYYEPLPVQGYANASEIPIAAYDLDITVPMNPVVNDEPTCVEHILTGVATQTGVAWHVDIALDDKFNLVDPSAALPMDRCWAHPYDTQYHYHGYSWKCLPDQGDAEEHSPLFGYAIDGFGVFGPRGEDGVPVTNADLDECHGHTHVIEWNGEQKEMFHYHVNNEYPYSIGCYRGTPVELPEHLQH
jgi:hypothetical protein